MMFNQVVTTGSHTVVGAVHAAKTTVPFIFYPVTSGSGNTKITGNCSIPKYEITAQVGTFVKVVAECWVDNGLTFGMATVDYVFSPSLDGYMTKTGATYATEQGSATCDTPIDTTNAYIKLGQEFLFGNTYTVERAAFLFDTSALAGKTVTAAYLNLYIAADVSDTDFNIVATNGQPTYPHNPLVAGDYAIANYSGSGGTLSTSGIAIGYNKLNLNATGLTWLNLTGTTKLLLVSSRDVAVTTPTGEEMVWLSSSEAGTGYTTQLVVSTV
jgi:hypothetical protein